VDIGGVGTIEPSFVGEQRHELVDRLLAEFDQVCLSRTPRWWSLEGHSGCGKTRIVQELYRRLAAKRQTGVKYWPLRFLVDPPIAKIAGSSISMRKRVFPENVEPEQESVPQWFWWGISCATRSGTPLQALSDDLTQFRAHQVVLEQRWRQLVSPRARHGAGLSSKKGEVFETAAGEMLGVAAGLQNVAFPGVRVLTLAAKWGFQGSPDRRLAVPASSVVTEPGRRRAQLVDELAPALERLAAAGLPLVIALDDLHLADENLLELIARLLSAQGAPVLVISTSLQGLSEGEGHWANRLIARVPSDRVCRVLADETWRDLAVNERQSIVRSTLPDLVGSQRTVTFA
jgi:predicted ATPase